MFGGNDSREQVFKKKLKSVNTHERQKMIDSNFADLSVRQQCDILKVSRSSYYYEPISRVEEQNIMNHIREIWLEYPFYGYRKIKALLVREGYIINHKKVQRLMQEMNLSAIYAKPKLSIMSKDHLMYPYLLNTVTITRINQVWATDITYIKMQIGFFISSSNFRLI